MGASSFIKHSGYQRNFKPKEHRKFEFTPVKISEQYNLLGIVNLMLETTQFGIPAMEQSTQKPTSTNVGNFPLKEKQNNQIWGFTPDAELLNGRLAMISFLSALLLEFFSGQGVLSFLKLL
jgi:hypothetical protein